MRGRPTIFVTWHCRNESEISCAEYTVPPGALPRAPKRLKCSSSTGLAIRKTTCRVSNGKGMGYGIYQFRLYCLVAVQY